ncbi:putative exportin-1 [Monocercomonoides exilis]|uniref:putative exportin-1 n=1 Tax=Monocercomonoides exilis TaxID=2049356 RepID=UPI003559E5CD|nr:putative exportin-1 [Monocercomonoides exilis]|eukprot:MONOS_30.1-p1 / transcript=MONOS_30.1 / gene=MONOS_30 / organism=Monocercomonoides_exilis_PA203 / gene_product=exportin-1 / transcript_product=exportin-1 / location=Mono_scaffold00001:79144-83726(+) / protein_length=1247 / sequence_SO=supercontig / SO=protein_coding / is_pseudo=false
MEKILDFSQPFDVALFDQMVTEFYSRSDPVKTKEAHDILPRFTNHPEAWTKVYDILERSQQMAAKFLALQVLDQCIAQRWKILSDSQRKAVKEYIIQLVIRVSSDSEQYHNPSLKPFITKLNITLISIVKHEWTSTWTSFVDDLCQSSPTNETLCENNLVLLRLLSEEIFDYGKETIVSKRRQELKEQYNTNFTQVFQLCMNVLRQASKVNDALVVTTLHTLRVFLSWIPIGYIFETELIVTLVTHLLPSPAFRVASLGCIAEIGGLTLEAAEEVKYAQQLNQLYSGTIIALGAVIPETMDLATTYMTSNPDGQKLLRELTVFLADFFKKHLRLLESSSEVSSFILNGMNWLLRLTHVKDQEEFKICIDFWLFLSRDLFRNELQSTVNKQSVPLSIAALTPADPSSSSSAFVSPFAPQSSSSTPSSVSLFASYPLTYTPSPPSGSLFANGGLFGSGGRGGGSIFGGTTPVPASLSSSIAASRERRPLSRAAQVEMINALHSSKGTPRLRMYSMTLQNVRKVLIARMARPEEVHVVATSDGEIEREALQDSAQIQLYKTMRETLIYLCHIDSRDTVQQMTTRLEEQMDPRQFNYDTVNALSWSVGAISGTMEESQEKDFLVKVLHGLLQLVDKQDKQEARAVVATDIMFVVSQYPRFLRLHWRFLKTVALKLIEFMKEPFEGVKDMATETFLKIAQKCKRQFVMVQEGEKMSFVDEVLMMLPSILSDLSKNQILNVCESAAWCIAMQSDPAKKTVEIAELFKMPNAGWKDIIQRTQANINTLCDIGTQRQLLSIISINRRCIRALQSGFKEQFELLFAECIKIFVAYSDMLISAINAAGGEGTQGEKAVATLSGQHMKLVQKEILMLFSDYFEECTDPSAISSEYLPSIMQNLLPQYPKSPKVSRDSDMLSLFATLFKKLRTLMLVSVPTILSSLFEPTMNMIKNNFEDYPDHRIAFYQFLRSMNTDCPAAFGTITDQTQMDAIVGCILWGIRHAERTVAESALHLMIEFVKNMALSTPIPVTVSLPASETDLSSSSSSAAGSSTSLSVTATTTTHVQLFYLRNYTLLFTTLIDILTDSFHKQCFSLQCQALLLLVKLFNSGQVQVRLSLSPTTSSTLSALASSASQASSFDPSSLSQLPNQQFICSILFYFLSSRFPQLIPEQTHAFVSGLFRLSEDVAGFEQHMSDFIVSLKEYTTAEGWLKDGTDVPLSDAPQLDSVTDILVPGLIPSGTAKLGTSIMDNDEDDT